MRKQVFTLGRNHCSTSPEYAQAFKLKKKQIQTEFSISSNDLSKAINLIKTNYELANLIDIEINILGLTQEQLIEFIRNWIKLHPDYNTKTKNNLNESRIILSSEIADKFLEDLHSELIIKSDIWEKIKNNVSPEYIAGINALFYFARNLTYSEYYRSDYIRILREARLIINSDEQVKVNIFHILDKTNFIHNCFNSLQVLSQTKLINTIINEFELDIE